jgi:hypothetical protein
VPLEPLLPLFHRLNREHFAGALVRSGKPVADLRWSDGRLTRTAGLYRRGRRIDGLGFREIVLSRPLLEPLPREATLSTRDWPAALVVRLSMVGAGTVTACWSSNPNSIT